MDIRALLMPAGRAEVAPLEGMRLTGEIPLREDMINDVIGMHQGSDVLITIEDRNQLVVRRGLWRATATLDKTVDTEHTPVIRLRLASAVIAWTLARVVRLPYLSIDGRFLMVDLGRVPAVREWEPVLRHLRRATLNTTKGVLHLQFDWWVQHTQPRSATS